MGLVEAGARHMIERIFDEAVKLINLRVDLREFKAEFFPNENRTLSMVIEGYETLNTGLVIENNQLRKIDKSLDRPTVTVYMDEDTFINVATQEMTMQRAYWEDYLTLEGEFSMRDFLIFDEMFQRHPDILASLNPTS